MLNGLGLSNGSIARKGLPTGFDHKKILVRRDSISDCLRGFFFLKWNNQKFSLRWPAKS